MKARAEWVQVVMGGVDPEEPRPHVHCTRCGERLVYVLPQRVSVWLAASRAFLREHARCRAQVVR